MPLVQTRGAASAQGFGEFAQAAAAVNYIEDVFSTYLYTGTGASQTITNNIDTTTYGGLTWIKGRSGTTGHRLTDTARGVTKSIASNSTGVEATETTGLTAFGTTGFTIGADADYNTSAATYVSWTFREQPKFFDVVTYTGTGANRTIAHNLGSVPGCIMVKRTDTAADWAVYHRSIANTEYLTLNTNDQAFTGATWWNSTTATSSVFSVGTDATVNASGGTYVAYLFAHDAASFGLTGTDNVISCSSYTGNGLAAGPSINLGYEPQFVIIKNASGSADWEMYDNMRGVATGGDDARLLASTSTAEENTSNILSFTATGFQLTNIYSNTNGSGSTYIYIAIRRGPMKVPTLGTSVYMGATRTGNGAVTALTAAGFPPDLYWAKSTAAVRDHAIFDRLRGPLPLLSSNNTQNEIAYTDDLKSFDMTGVTTGTDGSTNAYNQNGVAYVNWYMRRAPSFFDVVCYTGTGNDPQNFSHNLGAVPELIILKRRNQNSNFWWVYGSNLSAGNVLTLDSTNASTSNTDIFTTNAPTSSVFKVGGDSGVNSSAGTYVAYLFASCPGVSKVGSYTGTGATQTINCGFGASGSRFVLIKRTDSTGDWYVWDSARGMISGTDPSLLLNSTAAEVNANSVYAISTGFQIVSTAAGINASAGTYIFLSVA